MPIAVENRRIDLASLVSDTDEKFSIPLRFGLGAGLYFEYFRRPNKSPSHFIIGFNRNLDANLAARIAQTQKGNARDAIHDALRENALLFNLDRAPTTALMGMEMLAEQLADFQTIPDWQTCLRDMRVEITATDSAYRRIYLSFLQEIQTLVNTTNLWTELSQIADEWDALAAQFTLAMNDSSQLERASRLLRRIAFREEHFWGKVLAL